MLELLKVIVRAVVIERDDDGTITGERLTEPEVLYTPEQYEEWLAGVRAELTASNGKEGNADQHPDHPGRG